MTATPILDEFLVFDGVAVQRNFEAGTFWIAPNTEPVVSQWDGLHLGEPIGQGATFGPVVAARASHLGPLAAKLFLPIRDYDRPLLFDYATHEYRRASTDLGPRFVRGLALLESTDVDGRPVFVLVMERVVGKRLDHYAKDAIVPPDEQRRLTGQMLEALDTLERHNLLWKDIKPSNLMVQGEGPTSELVFIDHGSAWKQDAGTHVNNQYTGAYAAPEILLVAPAQNPPFTIASDIFSAGVTLLSAFTGGNPYKNNTERRTVNGTPALDSSTLDPMVAQVLAGMLVRDPAERATLPQLRAALDGRPPTGWAPDPYKAYGDVPPSQVSTEPLATEFRTVANIGAPKPNSASTSSPTHRFPTAVEAFNTPPDVPLPPLLKNEEPPAETNWLIKLGGADGRWMTEPNERRQYSAIGVALIVYFIYIVLGTAAFAWQATSPAPSATQAAMFGGFLGLLIGVALVNLDRTIVASSDAALDEIQDLDPRGEEATVRARVMSVPKKSTKFRRGFQVRVAIAIIASFLIGDALVIQMHTNEISNLVSAERAATVTAAQTAVHALNAGGIQQLSDALVAAREAKKTAEENPAKYEQNAKDEQLGKGSSGKPGCKSECIKWQTERDKANEYLRANIDKLTQNVTDAQNRLQQAKDNDAAAQKAKEQEIMTAGLGPLERQAALLRVMLQNPVTFATALAVMVFFMALELSALLLKWIGMNSTYERRLIRHLRLREYASMREAQLEVARVDATAKDNLGLIRQQVWLKTARATAALDRQAQQLAQEIGVQPPPPTELGQKPRT